MKNIGSTFAAELAAAGVNPDGIVWSPDGEISFAPDTSVDTIAAVNAVYAAHDPTAAIRADALVEIRRQRAPILDALAGIQSDAMVIEDTVTAQGAYAARQALKDIVVLQAFLAASTYDDMKAAIMAEYRRIALAAPVTVQTAFAALLA